MTNFEYYIAGGRGKEGWVAFVETAPFRTGGRAIDRYNNWLLEEHKEPILDDIEKKYLSNVIKPFRNRVSSIAKVKDLTFSDVNYYIDIHIDNDNDFCFLPSFKPSTGMYKNMEVNRKYTLKELGL
jgi:hypothetical protein